jgi:hypothetical protein
MSSGVCSYLDDVCHEGCMLGKNLQPAQGEREAIIEPSGVVILHKKYDCLWEAVCSTLNSLPFSMVKPSGVIVLYQTYACL